MTEGRWWGWFPPTPPYRLWHYFPNRGTSACWRVALEVMPNPLLNPFRPPEDTQCCKRCLEKFRRRQRRRNA